MELLTKKYEPLIKYFKQTFDTKLADVKLSLQLASTAAIILPGQIGMSPMQEKMFVLQNQGKENDPMYKMYLEVKKTLELNPNNPIVKKMLEMVESNDSKLENLAKFFYDVQFIASGWEVRQPRGISLRADRLIRDYLNLEQEQTYSTMDTEVDGNSDAEVNKAADAKIEQKEDEFNSEL